MMEEFYGNSTSGVLTMGSAQKYSDPSSVSWELLAIIGKPPEEPLNLTKAREFGLLLNGALSVFRKVECTALFPMSVAAFNQFQLTEIWELDTSEHITLKSMPRGPLKGLNEDQLKLLPLLRHLVTSTLFLNRLSGHGPNSADISTTEEVFSKVCIQVPCRERLCSNIPPLLR